MLKRLTLFLWIMVSSCSTILIAEERYELQSGDEIKIVVYGESDLTLETKINSDNIIRYPFLGDINVKGMTALELEQYITKNLSGDYLINPNVYVSVVNYRPFFIRGEVNSPGSYPYTPGLTIEKAISVAGGFSDHADKDNIFVVKEKDPQKKKIKRNRGYSVSPGDIITVEESFF